MYKKYSSSHVSNFNQSITQSEKSCDFCSGNLAFDPLGSFENEQVIVAASAIKQQDFDVLFILKKHNPLSLDLSDYVALFKAANKWFDIAIQNSDHGHSHPMLIWDSLPPAGASQIHAHAHGFLGRGHKLGHFRGYEEGRKAYASMYQGSDLTQDYINVHIVLGLGVRVGPHVVIAPMDAIKEHELVIFGPEVDESFAELVYVIHLTYIELSVFR